MKFPILHRSQIFPTHKMFGGKSFKVSPSNPMGLEYCTEARAEAIAHKIRKLGVNARIVKKKWGGNRVAHVVYVHGLKESLL
jgi:hypothetical protein